MIAPAVAEGYVLAGGQSRRMGADKARIAWPGRWPMAAWVAAVIARVVPRVSIVRAAPDAFMFPVEPWVLDPGAPIPVIVDDPALPSHPLRGVATALRAARSPLVLLAAVDLPDLTEDDVRRMVVAGAPCVAAGEPFALLAVLSSADADRAADLARSGAGVHALVRELAQVALAAPLRNLNRPPGDGPLAALRRRLPRIDARILEGERGRLAARGAVDPEAGEV